jgi:hypothetical protein
MDKDQAWKLALEALEIQAYNSGDEKYTEAITAIKQDRALDKMAENARGLGLDYEPAQKPVALHAMAKRRIFDAIRGAYDLGYNDARGAQAAHGDSLPLPGYKGRDVEADHGGALISALERYITLPAAAQPVVLPLRETEAMHDAVMSVIYKGVSRTNTDALWQAYRKVLITNPPAPTGKAPCARHCEATAFQITIRGLRGDIERVKAAQPAPSLTRSELRGLWLSRQAHMDGWDFYVAIDARLFGSPPAQPAPKERT